MTITFSPRAWYEYTGWQLEDKKTLKRINALIKDIERNGNTGIGSAIYNDLDGELKLSNNNISQLSAIVNNENKTQDR